MGFAGFLFSLCGGTCSIDAVMKRERSIAENTAIDSGAQVGGMVINLIAGVFLARILGDVGRGEYVLATSFAGTILFGMVNLGLELAASVLVAKDPRRLPGIHTLVVMACVAVGVVLLAVTLRARHFFTEVLLPGIDVFSLWMLILALPFWMYQYGCYGMLVGLGKIRARAVFDLAFSFAQNLLVIGILLVFLRGDHGQAIHALVFSYYTVIIVSCAFMVRLVARGGRLWHWPDASLVRDFYKYGFWVYVGNMGANFSQRIDQYFVQQISGSAGAFGVYTLATGLTQRTRVFPQALSRSSYARICSAPEAEAARLVASCFRQMLVFGLILVVLGSAASPLIPLVYSSEFAPAVIPFIIFLFGRMFHNCSWMLANYFSGHLAKPQVPMIVNWVLLPVQGVAAYFAMKMGGLVAVALITSASYAILFLVFLVMFLMWQKHAGLRELFVIQREDFAQWGRILRRLLGSRTKGT